MSPESDQKPNASFGDIVWYFITALFAILAAASLAAWWHESDLGFPPALTLAILASVASLTACHAVVFLARRLDSVRAMLGGAAVVLALAIALAACLFRFSNGTEYWGSRIVLSVGANLTWLIAAAFFLVNFMLWRRLRRLQQMVPAILPGTIVIFDGKELRPTDDPPPGSFTVVAANRAIGPADITFVVIEDEEGTQMPLLVDRDLKLTLPPEHMLE